jgi:hypothetical protein
MAVGMIHIGGLGHSGSTLLHFIVGSHPRCIALGEVWNLIRSPADLATASTTSCSCGRMAPACEFWGPLLPRLRGDGDYQPVLDRVEELYGDRIVVDSSKHAAVLQPGARVLYSIRDVRGWAVSAREVNLRGFLHWFRRNRIDRERLYADVPQLTVSYDELALNPIASVRRICRFLELDYDDAMIADYGNAEHHAIKCNRMKGDPDKMAAVQYDQRWLADRRWLIPAFLLPQVMKFNSNEVYGLIDNPFAAAARRARKRRERMLEAQ